MAPVLNDPNDNISIPCKIQVLRLWWSKIGGGNDQIQEGFSP
jgi:hypothetical protein